MFHTKIFRKETTEYQENDNPETIFSKNLSIPHDSPLKECRMFLETMREESKFQKNVIRKTRDMTVPIFRAQEKQKLENYHNYQKLLKYSKKRQRTQEFQKQISGKLKVKVKKIRIKTLRQFIDEKKIRMLVQNNKEEFEYVENILNDQKLRSNVFDETILIQRMHFFRKMQKGDEEKILIAPAKYKGLNPQHLRSLEQEYSQKAYNRRKYVTNRTKFQFFKSALTAEENLLKTKEKESNLVMKNLMNNFSQQILQNNHELSKINRCIHRLFLKYANNDTENIGNMYKIISKQKMLSFLSDFHISYKQNAPVLAIISEKQINEFNFLQILHGLSLKQGSKFQANVSQFLENTILNHPEIYLPIQWNIYERNLKFIMKYLKLKRFKEKLELIYESFTKKRINNSHQYNFDQMVQIMWMLKIYPFMISKKKLRFYYLYTQNDGTGVDIKDIVDIYMYIAISKQGNLEQNITEIVKKVMQFSKIQRPT